MSRSWKAVLIVALVASASSSSRAGFDPILTTTSSTATTTTFSYQLAFTTAAFGGTAQLNTGSFITLYDLYVNPSTLASSSATAGISVTQALVGVTPGIGSPPVDSPGLENLTFTYTGATLTANTNFLVNFTLNGLFTTQQNNYTSLSMYTAASGATGQTETTGFVSTPVAFTSAVPEPSSLALCGIAGVVGLIVARRNQRTLRPR